jgi:hypothetical protein
MDSHEKAELDMENDYEIFFSYTPIECCAACNEVNYSALLTSLPAPPVAAPTWTPEP